MCALLMIWGMKPVSLDLPAKILGAWKHSLLYNSTPLTRGKKKKPSYVELANGISFARCEKLEERISFPTGYWAEKNYWKD